jgi:hypothetical protein
MKDVAAAMAQVMVQEAAPHFQAAVKSGVGRIAQRARVNVGSSVKIAKKRAAES